MQKQPHQTFERDARACLRVIKQTYPEARIASGCPADCGHKSDVDILVFRPDVDKEKRITKRLKGREVNILITGDPARRRSLDHRVVELVLARHRHHLLKEVIFLKTEEGMKTEEAWCSAIGITEMDPYDGVSDIAKTWRQRRILAPGRMPWRCEV